jgi:ABC-type phosphate/phosphonate transport system substrate-binding protein
MTAIASLPMYDLPGMRAANQALWAALAALLRRDGHDVPDVLEDDDGPVPGRSFEGVLFTQTCGYPLQTMHRGQLNLLATPSYEAPGCGVMTHRAFIVVRDEHEVFTPEDLRGSRFALNAIHSNSGMNLPRRLFAPLAREGRFFGDIIETGSHAGSLKALLHYEADVASIDCVTWALVGDYAPEILRDLRIIAQTAISPTLPFVTDAATSPALAAALQRALLKIGAEPDYSDVRAGLRLASIGTASAAAYAGVLGHEQAARDAGYPVLA